MSIRPGNTEHRAITVRPLTSVSKSLANGASLGSMRIQADSNRASYMTLCKAGMARSRLTLQSVRI